MTFYRLLIHIIQNNVSQDKTGRFKILVYGRSFDYWKDYKNDTWVLTLPNGEMTNTHSLEGVFEGIEFYLRAN